MHYEANIDLYTRHWKYSRNMTIVDFVSDRTIKRLHENELISIHDFMAQFIKIISHYKKIGYNINVLQQTACLVVNPITVNNFAFLFNCTPVVRTSDSMTVPTYLLTRW